MKTFLDISDKEKCVFSVYPACRLNCWAAPSESIQCRHLLPLGTGGGPWAFRCATQTVEGIASATRTEEKLGRDPPFWCCTASPLIKTRGSLLSRYIGVLCCSTCKEEEKKIQVAKTAKILELSQQFGKLHIHMSSHVLTQYLPKHLHILCVDMPGHEGTTRTNTDDYSIPGQVKRIHQVNCTQPKQRSVRLSILQNNSLCSLSSVCGSRTLKQETFPPGWNRNGRKCSRSLRSLLPLRDLQHDSHLSRRSVSKSVHACVSARLLPCEKYKTKLHPGKHRIEQSGQIVAVKPT